MIGYILGFLLIIICFIISVVFTVLRMMLNMYKSHKPEIPSQNADNFSDFPKGTNPLFDMFPKVRQKIAWQKIGDFPTPIHKMTVTNPRTNQEQSFFLKREDMSSKVYGGNKVRTMEYQFPCALIRQKRTGGNMWGVGGLASNQAVMTSILVEKNCANVGVGQILSADEGSSWDNSFNLISVLSFTKSALNVQDNVFFMLITLIFKPVTDICFMLGGNCPTGVFGQAGGFVELCNQINSEPKNLVSDILLPVGSSCTITGLCIGFALAKKQGILPPGMEDLKIHGALIHHIFARIPFVVRWVVKFLGLITIEMMVNLGFPDVSNEFKEVVQSNLILNGDFAGYYGSPTGPQLEAVKVFGEGKIEPDNAPKPWLCSTFSGKMAAYALSKKTGPNPLIWCTKSLVQPIASKDLAEKRMSNLDENTLKWLSEGDWKTASFAGKEDQFTTI